MTIAVSHSHSRGLSVTLGILLLLAGLFSIAAPAFAGIAASVFFGWLVLLAGIAHLAYAWSERGPGAILWQTLIGIAYAMAGLSMLFRPIAGVVAITLILGFYIAVEGVFELIVFSRLRHIRSGIWFLVDGIISLLLATLIFLHWPSSSLWVVGTLVGVSMVFSGIARVTYPSGGSTMGLGSALPTH